MDTTEVTRRTMVDVINAAPVSRKALEIAFGADDVWDTKELQETFEVIGFAAPMCMVKKKDTGKKVLSYFSTCQDFILGLNLLDRRKNMEEKTKKMIETYQCPGCVCGGDVSCYEKADDGGVGCGKHVAGTLASYIGSFFLGMPKGFCRLGPCKATKISIFEKVEDGWGYGMFNVPVWKHLDSNGNTLVRGLGPRINYPWIHIFMGDQMAKIDCMIITQKDIDGKMD